MIDDVGTKELERKHTSMVMIHKFRICPPRCIGGAYDGRRVLSVQTGGRRGVGFR
jgi:hypothetical protein